jgi:hypothetical protein
MTQLAVYVLKDIVRHTFLGELRDQVLEADDL